MGVQVPDMWRGCNIGRIRWWPQGPKFRRERNKLTWKILFSHFSARQRHEWNKIQNEKLNKNPNYFSYLLFFFSFIHNFHSFKFIQSNQFRFFFCFFFKSFHKERLHKLMIFITEVKWPTGSKMEMVHCCIACKWYNL